MGHQYICHHIAGTFSDEKNTALGVHIEFIYMDGHIGDILVHTAVVYLQKIRNVQGPFHGSLSRVGH